jgi:DNA polymerase kappa
MEEDQSPMEEILPVVENHPVLVCPICNRKLIMDNSNFNKHVDECLNKVEVKAILKDQSDREKSESLNNSSGSPSSGRPSQKRVKR